MQPDFSQIGPVSGRRTGGIRRLPPLSAQLRAPAAAAGANDGAHRVARRASAAPCCRWRCASGQFLTAELARCGARGRLGRLGRGAHPLLEGRRTTSVLRTAHLRRHRRIAAVPRPPRVPSRPGIHGRAHAERRLCAPREWFAGARARDGEEPADRRNNLCWSAITCVTTAGCCGNPSTSERQTSKTDLPPRRRDRGHCALCVT